MANTRNQRRIDEARIQRAVNGLQIPMMQIVPLYAQLQRFIAEGQSDAQLHANAKLFLEPQLCQCPHCTRVRIAG